MAIGQAPNYRAAGVPEVVEEGYDEFLLVYNDTGSDVPEGSVVEISFANSSTAGNYPQIVQPATESTVMHKVGVVNNAKLSSATASYAGIKSATWGFVQTRGYCPKVLQASATTISHTLLTTNTSYNATDTGNATQTTATFGIVKTSNAVSPYTTDAWLYGKLVALT